MLCARPFSPQAAASDLKPTPKLVSQFSSERRYRAEQHHAAAAELVAEVAIDHLAAA